MANQIRITPDQMRTRAKEYRDIKTNELNTLIQKMDQMLSTLESEWEGEASRSYADRWRGSVRPDTKSMIEQLIDDLAASLDKTAQILEETDRAISSSISG
ncbi:MAG: WXG100 family type VII secretion target [Coriobacteriales bacterium]|jgi:WXG100 family type VII secretion target|nr:WXG100 family type VII secretion target [Coriobacteriales bacterium]